MCSGCGTWAAPAAWPVRCLRGGSRGDGKGEGRQAQSFKGKTRSARDQGWAAEGEAHFTAVEGDRKGQAAGRAGADWSGWSVPPWKRPGGNWSEDQGGGSGKSCVPGWHSDCTQVSRGVCVPRAPPLPCRGAPTQPLSLQRPHDPLPRPPAQPRLTSVLEPRVPERLGLPSVWAGPGLGSAAGARWAGNVGPACEELTIRCGGQNSHPREPRSSTEKALRGSPQSRETGHLRDQGCGRSPREKTGGAHDGLAVGCPAREAWEAVCLDAEPCWGRGCQGGCLARQAGCPRRRLTRRCGNLSSQAAALSAGGRGQMLSQALRRKSQAIFLLWLGVST